MVRAETGLGRNRATGNLPSLGSRRKLLTRALFRDSNQLEITSMTGAFMPHLRIQSEPANIPALTGTESRESLVHCLPHVQTDPGWSDLTRTWKT